MNPDSFLPQKPPRRSGLFGRLAQRAILLVLLALTRVAFSTEVSLPSPASTSTVLSVKWSAADASVKTYDLSALERLPRKEILTALPSTFGSTQRHRWEGVPLNSLLGLAGASGQGTLRLFALNGYFVDIPLADIEKYDPILAYRRDGKLMGIREKGPLIVIYPFDEHPALQDQQHLNRTAWQVHEIQIR